MSRWILPILAGAMAIGCQASGQPPIAPTRAEPAHAAESTSLLKAISIPESPQPPMGRYCRVYLRRDALGMAGASALGPTIDGPMNRAAVVTGSIDQVTPDWIVLKGDNGTEWVPRSMVLVVEVLDK